MNAHMHPRTAFQGSLIPLLESARLSMTGSLTSLSQDTVDPGTNSLKATMDSYFLDPVTKNVQYENIGFIAIAAVIACIPILAGGSVLAKRPKVVKGCSIISLPLTLLLQLLAIVFLLFGVIFGDGMEGGGGFAWV
jgi:hypothetical protein